MKYLYVACDGGLQNTLAGSGGILEIQLEPERNIHFEEFEHGRGGSPHFLKPSPDKRHLVASCANAPQLYVFPLRKDKPGYDLANPKIINNFCELGIPTMGPDCTADFFDFWGETSSAEDSENIVTHFNRLLIKVNIVDGRMKILHDFSHYGPRSWQSGRKTVRNPKPPLFFHQVTVKGDYVIIDDALQKCIYVLKKTGRDTVELLYETGDGYCSGHHCEYLDAATGRLHIARPSFNFAAHGHPFKVHDNVLSLYTISEDVRERKVRTWQYAYYLDNHAPVDTFVEKDYFYAAYGVPGSIMKICLKTGHIDKRTRVFKPSLFKRIYYSLVDFVFFHLTHGTSYKGFDNPKLDFHQHVVAFTIGLAAGTRGGFFTLAPDPDPEKDRMYACHRGFNRLYVLKKSDLTVLEKVKLPRRTKGMRNGRVELFHLKFFYRMSRYLSRGIGTHHGKVVTFPSHMDSNMEIAKN